MDSHANECTQSIQLCACMHRHIHEYVHIPHTHLTHTHTHTLLLTRTYSVRIHSIDKHINKYNCIHVYVL